jgi:hypothetical protein
MSNGLFIFRVPDDHFEERRYIAEVVLGSMLGLPYQLEKSRELKSAYVLTKDGLEIVVGDHFFSHRDEEKGYLSTDAIPADVKFYNGEFAMETDMPVIYGKPEVTVEESGIHCAIDIFASAFFMLTRLEEVVVTKRDYLQRFPAQESLAFKKGFLHRPVVNEWVEFLRNLIRKLFPFAEFRPSQRFELLFTHDIDLLNAPVSIREFAKDIVKRKSVAASTKRLNYLVKGSNPYDLFDFFMNVSERNNTLSHFYFMTGHNVRGKDGENYNHTPLYRKVLKQIKDRGHIIGFHPSLLTYNNTEMFAHEKNKLEQDIDGRVTEGRQHALRFDMPGTWNIWNDHGMKTDSTLGFSAHEGFRCGTGFRYRVFDVKQRRMLELQELPLVVMDTTLHVNRRLNIEQSMQIIRSYIDVAKKYNMPITLLFHNLIDESIDWKNWKQLYEELFL